MTRRPTVHVTGSILSEVEARLTEHFELASSQEGAEGVLSVLTTRIDQSYLEKAGPSLKIVSNYASGVDNIDLAAATKQGVVITNTPDVLTHATAELAIAMMLALLRRVAEGDRLIRARRPWQFELSFMLGESLEGKRVAVVGAGRVGRETARLAEALGAHPFLVGRAESLAAALSDADIVTLHCPLTTETHHLIGEAELTTMRPGAILINTARGPIVDEQALVRSLADGRIAGAALDVFEFEPEVSEALLLLENVVLTPHLGSATKATRTAMGFLAADALIDLLINGTPPRHRVA